MQFGVLSIRRTIRAITAFQSLFFERLAMANILVVDDHIDTCKVLVRLLKHLQLSAVCAYGGEEALHYIAEHELPDLVILDVMMPGMDGLEVLRTLRADQRTAGLRIVMFSAVTDSAWRHEAMRIGATDFWPKVGLDFDDLDRRLRAILPNAGSTQA